MAWIRIATFNCENLFARFEFNKDVDPEAAVRDGWDANRAHFSVLNDDAKRITAQAIKETKADILALQEVEPRHPEAVPQRLPGGRTSVPLRLRGGRKQPPAH